MKIANKAFTLVEILIALSIIGLLLSITMAYVNQSKRKSDDSAVQTLVESVGLRVGAYYNQKGKYAGACEFDDINALVTKIEDIFGEDSVKCKEIVGNYGFDDEWILLVNRKIDEGTAFCIDSNNFSGIVGVEGIDYNNVTICPQ
jgi:prepilin-type N-terminal cleavage/methylation domain-containing protein